MSYYTKLTKMARTREGKVIMDCACGTGWGLEHLHTLNPKELIGVDISPKFINRCIRERTEMLLKSGIKLMIGDIRDLSYFQDYFDYFYCCETLEHLRSEDNEKAVKSIVKTIKPRGKLLVCVPGHEDSIENPRHLQVFNSEKLKALFGRGCILLEEERFQKRPNDKDKSYQYNILMVFEKRTKRGIVQKPRPMIKFIRDRFGDKPLIGVEVGVKAGKNAYSILTELNMKRLFLVDPWEAEAYKRFYETTVKKFAYYHNVEIMKTTSEWAAKRELRALFDFVYIDGNHTYDSVKQDIELWYPKVKKGGVIGGHDWQSYMESDKRWPLRKAVMEFCHSRLYHLHIGFIPRPTGGDWWIVKGDKIEDCD